MRAAIRRGQKGEADAAVSAGNTGALMAMAKFELKTMPGIERPAIAAVWPTIKGQSIVLDLGASIGADARHLVNLCAMGSAMARVLLGIERPSVGLLNIGVEEAKGLEEVRCAGSAFAGRENGRIFDYCGFVEGDDIGKGTVDVVVTEGFTGNIALRRRRAPLGSSALCCGASSNEPLRGKSAICWRAAFRAVNEKMDRASPMAESSRPQRHRDQEPWRH